MNRNHTDLLNQISKFEIDHGGETLRFADRLARENGWRRDYAQRVVDEYKRFIFLAMTAGHQVTPSDQVDQAWHLHLTYTRSYWDELCGKTLGRPLHHDPTRGGSTENEKFHDWYERTLESCEHAFGERPPADIWPPASWRFSDVDFQRVNRRRTWIVSKARTIAMASVATLMIAALSATSCATRGASQHTETIAVIGFMAVICALIFIFGRRGGSGGGCGAGCGGHTGGDGGGAAGCGGAGCGSGCGGGGCGGGCGGG